ncbi:hypothetical protein BASA60_001680 [Batrachochytrium salamandrivorans]|nr:hypothetical protein BASA60_001680 [Batrachochytrium salamandrivorans]
MRNNHLQEQSSTMVETADTHHTDILLVDTAAGSRLVRPTRDAQSLLGRAESLNTQPRLFGRVGSISGHDSNQGASGLSSAHGSSDSSLMVSSSVSLGQSVRNNTDGDPRTTQPMDYIGATLYTSHYKTSIQNSIRSSSRVLSIVEDLVQDHYAQHRFQQQRRRQISKQPFSPTLLAPDDPFIESIRKQYMAQIDRTMDAMVADMTSTRIVRFFGFVVHNLLARMYHRGVHINESEIARLRQVAQDAQKKGISLVFLPCHKSHIDYLVVSYILYRLGFALPHIAAGDNLNMPFVGWLLRHNGAFFIRRQWGEDKMYNGIMKEYIETLLERGYNIEAFIEGTRSRTGKPLQPKFGILKIIFDAVWDKRVEDLVIVPVSIGYDKVIETPSYANELLGTPKQKESLVQLLNNVNILQLKWGRIDVRFGQPFSLKEYISRERSRRGFGMGLDESNNLSNKAVMLQSLGYKVLGDVNKISVVMPTALVGTTLLTLRGRGVGRNELIRKVNWLRKEIVLKGGHVAEFGNTPLSDIVDRVTLLVDEGELLEPVYHPAKRFELSFYRNQVIHLFISECIVLVSMYATIKAGGPIKAQRIAISPNLSDDVSFLSQLLSHEFVYGEGGLDKNLAVTISKLSRTNVLVVGAFEGNESSNPVGARRWVTLSAEERRIGRETFDFYCFLLWPFVETYWLAAVSLYTIVPGRRDGVANTDPSCGNTSPGSATTDERLHWVDERIFLKRCQHFGRTLYCEGDLSYFEAVNKDTLVNAIGRLKEMGVVLIHKGAHPLGASLNIPGTGSDGIAPKEPKEAKESKDGGSGSWIALSLPWVPTNQFPEDDLQVASVPSMTVSDRSAVASSAKSNQDRSSDDSHSSRSKWRGYMEGFPIAPPLQDMSRKNASVNSMESTVDAGDCDLKNSHQTSMTSLPNSVGCSTRPPHQTAVSAKHSEKSIISPRNKDSSSDEVLFDSWYQIKPSGKLWDLCEQIGRFRREGKNRRDTNTVAVRVLRLARLASYWSDGNTMFVSKSHIGSETGVKSAARL